MGHRRDRDRQRVRRRRIDRRAAASEFDRQFSKFLLALERMAIAAHVLQSLCDKTQIPITESTRETATEGGQGAREAGAADGRRVDAGLGP
jgi:hypothetical protein